MPMSSMVSLTPVARFLAEKSLQLVPATITEREPFGACRISRIPPTAVVAWPFLGAAAFAVSASATTSLNSGRCGKLRAMYAC